MSELSKAIEKYARVVRTVASSGSATDERSYYPAINGLLTDIGKLLTPRKTAVSEPLGIAGDHPDVALIEPQAHLIVLPVEVKPAGYDMEILINSEQARRYARSFGGGQVLLTNLLEFSLAEFDSSQESLVRLGGYRLAENLESLNGDLQPVDDPEELLGILEVGSTVRGNLQAPKDVARLLAWHARQMKGAIEDAVAAHPGEGARYLLEPIADAFVHGLDTEIEDELLLPTVVQTLVYGIFAAWLQSPTGNGFDWRSSAYRLEVPIFAEILHACLRPALIRHADLFPRLDAAGRVLEWVDKASFEEAFSGRAIEYFYEPFLAEFDPHLRDQLGVWYTPREIAQYQSARVDHHLQEDLGLSAGLGDDAVLVLDPASGTGTYIIAVLEHIYETHIANGEPPEVAASRTKLAALKRVIGFEILPAAFLISHLHVGRTLAALGAPLEPGERLRIYLTNSLTGWDPSRNPVGLTLFPELEEDLESSRAVKQRDPVIAVLGNPPYQGYSTAQTEEERRLIQPWIAPLWPEWGVRKHRLNDLYVRFWRIAIERIVTLTGRGVVSFITNRQWLGGRSYPTVRETVVRDFNSIIVDDLHGGYHDSSVAGDESIFSTESAAGIKIGTAIVTAIRNGSSGSEQTALRGRHLRGPAAEKRAQLHKWSQENIDRALEEWQTSRGSKWRFTSDPSGDFPAIDEYFEFYRSGVQPVRDEAVLSTSKDELTERMWAYFDSSLIWADLVARFPGFAVTRARYDGARTRNRLLAGSSFHEERVVRYLHRPLDARWLYWESEHELLNRPRPELMPFWIDVDQRALVVPQTRRRPGAARAIVATQVPGFASTDPDARAFPLWMPRLTGAQKGELGHQQVVSAKGANVASRWVNAARNAGLSEADNDIAETIFYALAGIMVSKQWLSDQPVQSGDFPDLPLPADKDHLVEAAILGRTYGALCDPDVAVPTVTTGRIDPALAAIGIPDATTSQAILTQGRKGFAGGKRVGLDVLWDDERGWRNIPDEVWDFDLGGFEVLPKWLSYRVGKPLDSAERENFMCLARRIRRIISLHSSADEIYSAARQQPLLT